MKNGRISLKRFCSRCARPGTTESANPRRLSLRKPFSGNGRLKLKFLSEIIL